MTPKRKRLWLLLGSLGVLGVAAALVLTALNDNIVFFYSPTQIAEKKIPAGAPLSPGRPGRAGSVKKPTARRCASASPTRTRPSTSSIAACCPICSAKARAWSPRARSARRHLRGARGAGQARRELHAAGGREGAEGSGPLERRQVSAFATGGRQAPGAQRRPESPHRSERHDWRCDIAARLHTAGSRRFASLQRLPPACAVATVRRDDP